MSTRNNKDSSLLLKLIAFRILNALTLNTFFQPDEYFQSLEPAWDIAFGSGSGAWITWEWKERLRSSLHPLFFAGVYRAADSIAHSLDLSPSYRSQLLISSPKVLQAVFAALSDYYTLKLARRAYGVSTTSNGALLLTVISPWQCFCSTRTLSNSVETTLTAIALYNWPFEAAFTPQRSPQRNQHWQMCTAFAFAALATILRPTNVLIWLVIAIYTAAAASNFRVISTIKALLVESKAALISGFTIFAISVFSDRLYYGEWTFPPLRFIHFNVVQSLAVFYGRNRPDYYITEGLPLLLTTSLPFAAWGLYRALTANTTGASAAAILRPLGLCIVIFPALMSLIAHKEVRFLYPLLPALNVLAADPFVHFFFPSSPSSSSSSSQKPPQQWGLPRKLSKKLIFMTLLSVNALFGIYITQIHQRGVVDVLGFLRSEYEQQHHHHHHHQNNSNDNNNNASPSNMSVKFLMPCHSTPWRSHLVHTSIHATALSCEPPIHVPISKRDEYMDEADVFYDDPKAWLKQQQQQHMAAEWPDYLVFFAQLEPVMREFGEMEVTERGKEKGKEEEKVEYEECWRGFNTHWHDDWRRRGDVIVWKRQ